jgi:Zn-dependent protease with chaperone function
VQTEGGLAFVLAHEISHVLARHGSEKMVSFYFAELVSGFLRFSLFAISAKFTSVVDAFPFLVLSKLFSIDKDVQSYCVEKPHSRVCETEADRIGVELMTLAGYDARQAVENWRRMTAAESWRVPPAAAAVASPASSSAPASSASSSPATSSPPASISRPVAEVSEWDQSHPSHATRIADISALLSHEHIARLRSVHVDNEAVQRSARLLMPSAAIAAFETRVRAAAVERQRQRAAEIAREQSAVKRLEAIRIQEGEAESHLKSRP